MSETSDKLKEARRAAKLAGLHYVDPSKPGLTRVKSGSGFIYKKSNGKTVRDDATLGRIKSLVIPPAWRDVWISKDPKAHLQCVGFDARGRKQYRYHPNWTSHRNEAKYDRIIHFAQELPTIRRITKRQLKQRGLSREKVLAAVIQIMEKTLIRVGNDEYARTNNSYGLTTLRDHHAKINGKKVIFNFKGKSGVKHSIDLEDRELARIVKECRELPDQELFGYLDDDGKPHDVGSTDVNAYLKEIAGDEFTAKDFRTWAGTVLAAKALQEMGAADTKAMQKKNVVRAIEQVAARLGNTVAVCKKCYIHPAILGTYLDGSLVTMLSKKVSKELKATRGLTEMERAVLNVLRVVLKKMKSKD